MFCKVKKVSLGAVLDVVALGFLIGQSIGRWGNFVNAEAYGELTDLPWGMTINGYGPYHPTFLYESLWNAVGFVALHFLSKKRRFDGQIFLYYIAWYGLGRFFIEGLRTDSLMGGGIRASQLLAIVSLALSLAIIAIVLIFRKPSNHPHPSTSMRTLLP